MLRSLFQHSTIPKRKRNNKLFLNRITRETGALAPAIGNLMPAEEALGHSYYIHWHTLAFISLSLLPSGPGILGGKCLVCVQQCHQQLTTSC